jgi:hypothetical protein
MPKKFFLWTSSIVMALSLAACGGPNAMDEGDTGTTPYGGNQSGSAILGNDTGTGLNENQNRNGIFGNNYPNRYDTFGNRGMGDRIDNDAQGFFNENRLNPNVQYNGGPAVNPNNIGLRNNRGNNIGVYEYGMVYYPRGLNRSVAKDDESMLKATGLNPWAMYDQRINNNHTRRDGFTGFGNNTNGAGRDNDNREYGNRGYLGYVDQNPNLFPNLAYDERNQEDAQIMADMANSVKGVDDATVFIAGGQAYVALDIDQNLETNKQLQVHDQVQKALQFKMPRYNVHLTTDALWFSWVKNIRQNFDESQIRNDMQTRQGQD